MPIVDRLRKVVELHGGNATGVMTIEQGVKRLESLDFGGSSGVITDGMYKHHEFTGSESIFGASDILYIGKSAFFWATLASGVSAFTLSLPSCEAIGAEAFLHCTAFSEVEAPNCTYIGQNAFQGASNLETVSFPEVLVIDEYAFTACNSLTSLSFPKAEYIGREAFEGTGFLGDASTCLFPKCKIIGSKAFADCRSLSAICFSKVDYVGVSAFAQCIKLAQVTFTDNVGFIDESAFTSCLSLFSLTLGGSSVCKLVSPSVFYNTSIFSGSGRIYVPSSLVSVYKTAPHWSAFYSRFIGF